MAANSSAALHHGTKLSKVSRTSGVSPAKPKAAYAAGSAQPTATTLIVAGQKALAARAKKVLTPDADPTEAP